MMKSISWLTLVLLMTACGGGGGGGSSSIPASPSVSVNGNLGTYWQDDPVSISFSVSNMDSSTTSYSVAGSLGNNNFEVNSSSGTFTDISDDYLEAGDYSLTVTATDAGGKTASRSFQLTVDLIATGLLEACDPILGCYGDGGNSVIVASARDGQFAIYQTWLTGEGLDAGVYDVRQLTCSGLISIDGIDFSGTATCDGWLPVEKDANGRFRGFSRVRTVEISSNAGEEVTASLNFYAADGTLVENWINATSNVLEQFNGWPDNSSLKGQYTLSSAGQQYGSGLIPIGLADQLGLAAGDFIQDFYFLSAAPRFLINDNYQLQSMAGNDGSLDCAVSGQLTQGSIDEYASVHSSRGSVWQSTYRVMSANYAATGCSGFDNTLAAAIGFPSPPLTFDQPNGAVALESFQGTGNDGTPFTSIRLVGPGNDQPFEVYFIKACELDGTATVANADLRFGSCEPQ